MRRLSRELPVVVLCSGLDADRLTGGLQRLASFLMETQTCTKQWVCCMLKVCLTSICLYASAAAYGALEREVYDAERHLLLGTQSSPQHLANLEYDWYDEDESHTAPLYAARAVLPYLLLGNIRGATLAYETFIKRLTEAKSNLGAQDITFEGSELKIFPSLPLLNFLGLLLPAVLRGRADSYRQLRSHYGVYIKDVGSWDEVRKLSKLDCQYTYLI